MISLTSPVKTRAHGWPAGWKLLALCAVTFGLFFLDSLAGQIAALFATLALYASAGALFLRSGLRRLWVLWPFLVLLGLWHLIEGSYTEGAIIILRMASAMALANLVTMTTKLSEMIEVIKFVTAPLRRFGLQTKPLEIAVALVIRMTPELLAKGKSLTEAWQARSARRPNWRVVLPFTLIVIDDADYVSDALKARGGLLPEEET